MTAPKRRQEWWRAKAAIDALIDADAFDAAATEALSHRRSYASAASCLLEIINCPARDLIPAFLKSQTFAAYRFGVSFGVIPSTQEMTRLFTADDLREVGGPGSRLALIAIGEPFDWETLDRVSRAVFVLRRLVQAMRDR